MKGAEGMSMEADMPMLQILVTAVGLTLGSLLVAISLSCLAWWLATRVHHPRWGAAFLLIIVGSCQSAFNRDPLSARKRDPLAVARIG
ncbi:MAG: hypothetical protein B7Y88_15250 [Sphingomonadales bacterium 32-64-17]|nr:MAG: hypothetical protein B7Y88_15250 [Sphingomonadales bacterium 32-64-17]